MRNKHLLLRELGLVYHTQGVVSRPQVIRMKHQTVSCVDFGCRVERGVRGRLAVNLNTI